MLARTFNLFKMVARYNAINIFLLIFVKKQSNENENNNLLGERF